MAGVVRPAAGTAGPGTGALPDAAAARARRRTASGHSLPHVDRLREHHPDRTGAVVPRRRGRRAPLPRLDPVERGDHGAPRPAPGSRCGRPHFDLRLLGRALRGRLQPLLPRQVPPRRRRPGLHPGPRVARHLRPRVPRGPANRRPARRLPPGAQPSRRRHPVVSASAADAGLLGVPDGVDGPGPDERDLPGPVQPLPARPGHQGHLRPARMGVPRRRRDGRAGEPRADPGGRQRGAGQPDLRDQLQPAAPRRPGARQRQDHPGAGVVLPRRRLERHQGGVGPRMGHAAARRPRRRTGQPDEHHARRRLSDLQGQRRQLRARPLLRPRPAHQGARQGHVRRRYLESQARRARLPQGLRGLPRRDRAQGPADGDPGQDHQGLFAGRPLPGPQCHASDEKACAGRPQGLPRRHPHPDQRRGTGEEPLPAAVLPPRPGCAGDPLHARPAKDVGRLRSGAPDEVEGADAAGPRHLQGAQEGLGQPRGRDHHGDGPHIQGTVAGQGDWAAHRAHHSGRGSHVRHGLVVPEPEDLQPQRPALHRRGRRTDARLQGKRSGPDPARGHQRGRF